MNLIVNEHPLAGAAWLSASGNLDRRWLQVMGDRPPGQLVCFTLCEDTGAEIACTTGYVVTDPCCYEAFNWHTLLWSRERVFAEQPELTVDAPVPPESCFPMLALVQPGYDFGISTVGPEGDRGVHDLLRGIFDWAGDCNLVSVVALYAQSELEGPLTRLGWYQFRGSDRAITALAGYTSFKEFAASLSRNARKQIRADGRILSSNSVTLDRARVSEHTPVLLSLRSELVQKYGAYVDQYTDANRLRRLLDVYGEDGLRLFLARDELRSTVLGFALFVVTGEDVWSAFWVGSRRTDNRSDRVYFGCLFYAAIASALDSHIKLIDYGLGTDAGKLRRGCRPLARNVFVSLTPRFPTHPDLFIGHPRLL